MAETPKLPPSPWQSPKYTGQPWWNECNVVVITGSNRGLGFELLRELANEGITVILADKDDTTASMAAAWKEELGGLVFAHPVDVTSPSSAEALAKYVADMFFEVDVLINNAGIWPTTVSPEDAEAVINVNYVGTKIVTEALMPIMKPGGKIINVTSRTGFYQRLGNEKVKAELGNVETLTLEGLDGIVSKYLEDVKTGQFEKEGWIHSRGVAPQYSESKMFLSAYTLVLNKTLQAKDPEGQKVFVCAFCPGFTETDMTRGREMMGIPTHPVEVGVDTGVWLALMPSEEFAPKAGKLWAERVEYPWTWVPWIDPLAVPV